MVSISNSVRHLLKCSADISFIECVERILYGLQNIDLLIDMEGSKFLDLNNLSL